MSAKKKPVVPAAPTVVLDHELVRTEHARHQKMVTSTIGHYHATMEAIMAEEGYDETTFAETFNVEAFLTPTFKALQEQSMAEGTTEEEHVELFKAIARSWSLVSLCTKLPIPQYLVEMDQYVMEAYRYLVKSYKALHEVSHAIANETDEGNALLAQATENINSGKTLSVVKTPVVE